MLEFIEIIKPYLPIILGIIVILIILILIIPNLNFKKQTVEEEFNNPLQEYDIKDELNLLKVINDYFEDNKSLILTNPFDKIKTVITCDKNYLKTINDLKITQNDEEVRVDSEKYIEVINQLHQIINIDKIELVSTKTEQVAVKKQIDKCKQSYLEIINLQSLIDDKKLNEDIDKCLNEIDKSKNLRNNDNQEEYDHIYTQHLPQLVSLLKKYSNSVQSEKEKTVIKNHLDNVLKMITASLSIINLKENDDSENDNSESNKIDDNEVTREYDLAKEKKEALAISKNTYD